ncbi:MAG: hypothetical protein QXX95_01615 [Nitrososphaerales archaeon]
MGYPLRNLIYELIKAKGNYTDKELLNDINKRGYEIGIKEMNRVLMHLEILGLISVRWSGKDKRRIEILQQKS